MGAREPWRRHIKLCRRPHAAWRGGRPRPRPLALPLPAPVARLGPGPAAPVARARAAAVAVAVGAGRRGWWRVHAAAQWGGWQAAVNRLREGRGEVEAWAGGGWAAPAAAQRRGGRPTPAIHAPSAPDHAPSGLGVRHDGGRAWGGRKGEVGGATAGIPGEDAGRVAGGGRCRAPRAAGSGGGGGPRARERCEIERRAGLPSRLPTPRRAPKATAMHALADTYRPKAAAAAQRRPHTPSSRLHAPPPSSGLTSAMRLNCTLSGLRAMKERATAAASSSSAARVVGPWSTAHRLRPSSSVRRP